MLHILDYVKEALANQMPVVALESTLITHGLPRPENVETALASEECVRAEGAVPATIAVIDGLIRIGLSSDEIAWLGSLDRSEVRKVSSADLPFVVSAKQHGATTVAATMICAKLAGIEVFATGGLGGVHRGGETSMDISADLFELARTDVAVVCAGAKSILDIGRTLEVLETFGVPVAAFGQKNFPAFHYADSGFAASISFNEADEIARFWRAKKSLGIAGGMVIGNPVPKENAMDQKEVESFVRMALQEADDHQLQGKEVTPFLLKKLEILSKGKSVTCNIALIKNNATVAARIANEMASPRGFEPLLLP